MKIEEIRTNNVKRLVTQYGSNKALAERLGRDNDNQISHWVNNSRSSKTGKPTYISSSSCRQIERKLSLPEGWMDIDHENETGTLISATDESVFTLLPVISLSGTGKDKEHPVFKETLESVGVDSASARLLKTDSLNMSPTIGRDSWVMIDCSDTTPKEGGIYLIQDGERAGLKRLIYEYSYLVMDSVWVMKNDNPDKRKYPEKFLPQTGKAKIIGRVVWYDNKL